MSEIVTKIIQVLGIHYNHGRTITVIEFVGSVSLQPYHILPTGTADFPMHIYNSCNRHRLIHYQQSFFHYNNSVKIINIAPLC